ncbi:MAG: hypothetical protein PHF63_04665 [Herbinix sp.]|nr:hypothetical protein [Herbinix sp.]
MLCNKVVNSKGLLFVLLQIILYMTFLILDFTGEYINIARNIKFSIIIICFCYAIFQGKGADRSIIFCLKTALLFTVISDLFILMMDYYIYGVLTFIVVQQLYGARLILSEIGTIDGVKEGIGDRWEVEIRDCGKVGIRDKEKNVRIYSIRGRKSRELFLKKLALRIFFQVAITLSVCIMLIALGASLEVLIIISAFYFVCIITNTVTAIKAAFHTSYNEGNVLFAIGMGLFLLCDINVGIFNLSSFVALPENIYDVVYPISSILMWIFYAPSQVLITLSTTKMEGIRDDKANR